MKKHVVAVFSIVLSFGIVFCGLTLFFSVFLGQTVFSTTLYEKIITSPDYVAMVKSSIIEDLSAQSSYVAIPLEDMTIGIDDSQLMETLRNHARITVKYMNYSGAFVKATYPSDLFYTPLEKFIQKLGTEEGFRPTQDQYNLMHAVAADSAAIVVKHTNLLNMDLTKEVPEFAIIQKILFQIRNAFWLITGLSILLIGILFLLNRKKISRAVLFFSTSLWIVGALLLVPSIVLEFSGITRRLALQTGYLKNAVDSMIAASSELTMTAGLVLFLLSSILLVARIIVARPNH